MKGITRAKERHWLPGQDAGAEKYFVQVAEFGLVGRGIYNGAVLFEPDTLPLAILQAGVVDFLLPHADGRDRRHRGSAVSAANTTVYEDLDDELASWIIEKVGELNPAVRGLLPNGEPFEAGDVEGEDDLAEGDELEDDLVDEGDAEGESRGNLGSSPGEPSGDETAATCAGATPSPPPSSTTS